MAGLIACPYAWCSRIAKISVAQFMAGYIFALLGYPFCVALCGSLFSKVLGPIPQVSTQCTTTSSSHSIGNGLEKIVDCFLYRKKPDLRLEDLSMILENVESKDSS